jgi:hypothetical protein
MNLGAIEAPVVAALQALFGGKVEIRSGPWSPGPETGLRAQVFVDAAAFDDAGGVSADGSHVGRIPWATPAGQGFAEQRPASVDLVLTCACALHRQAQELAGIVVPAALGSLATLGAVRVSDPLDARNRLRFTEQRAAVARVRCARSDEASTVTVVLRLQGFLHVELVAPGGLGPTDPYAAPIDLEIHADPAGIDIDREYVLLRHRGSTPLALAGWTLQDAARRPHVFRFDDRTGLLPGGELRLWTGRGTRDTANLWWGRRKAVWNNSGDVALLHDPDGVERARGSWSPPLPEVPLAAQPKRPRRAKR